MNVGPTPNGYIHRARKGFLHLSYLLVLGRLKVTVYTARLRGSLVELCEVGRAASQHFTQHYTKKNCSLRNYVNVLRCSPGWHIEKRTR